MELCSSAGSFATKLSKLSENYYCNKTKVDDPWKVHAKHHTIADATKAIAVPIRSRDGGCRINICQNCGQ